MGWMMKQKNNLPTKYKAVHIAWGGFYARG
jgi:hypothetical protein